MRENIPESSNPINMGDNNLPPAPPIGWNVDGVKAPNPTTIKVKKHKKRHSSSSSSTSSGSSSDSGDSNRDKSSSRPRHKNREERRKAREERRKVKRERRQLKKAQKLEHKKAKKEMKKYKRLSKSKSSSSGVDDEPDFGVPLNLMNTSAKAPETREQYEARQSEIRREIDPVTGRSRLIKGDGEVLEEIVSRDRHQMINKQATQGDGEYFQTKSIGWAAAAATSGE